MVIQAVRQKKQGDYWEAGGQVFVTGGQRFGVDKSGKNILLKAKADIKDTTKPPEADVSSGSIGQNDVTKLLGGNILPPATKTASKQAVLLHPGGRPTKEGKVSRMTDWRRRKKQ